MTDLDFLSIKNKFSSYLYLLYINIKIHLDKITLHYSSYYQLTFLLYILIIIILYKKVKICQYHSEKINNS